MDSEIDRLKTDLESDDTLRSEATEAASNLEDLVSWATARGYAVTLGEITTRYGIQLSDAELDQVAGGRGIAPPRLQLDTRFRGDTLASIIDELEGIVVLC
jgi:predicted ribosomally synthesized peptide with nif11-like leader